MDEQSILHELLGKVLVSTTNMDDDNFHEALIFICAHDEEGSIGVRFNKVIESKKASDIEKDYNLKLPYKPSKVINIYDGGPIESDGLFVLGAERILGRVELQQITLFTDAKKFFEEKNSKDIEDFILCKGFCGWDIGQLEEEINDSAWITVDVELDDVFCNNPEKKWRELYKKLGISKPDNVVPYSGHA